MSNELETGLQTEWPDRPAAQPPPRRSAFAFARELPVLVLIAFTLALLMKTFLIQAFFIPSESMEPTLHGCSGCNGDRVLVNKLAYRFREPARGEVIVFVAERDLEPKSFFERVRSFLTEGLGVTTPTEQDFIKRVIGVPGDKIEVRADGVYITPQGGERFKLREPYIKRTGNPAQTDARPCGDASGCEQGPQGVFPQAETRVPDDMYFVMGDNRANSSDSRSSLGTIHRRDVVGKAFVRIWPPGRWGVIETPTYCADPRVTCGDDAGEAAAAVPGGAPVPVPLPLVALAAVATRRRET